MAFWLWFVVVCAYGWEVHIKGGFRSLGFIKYNIVNITLPGTSNLFQEEELWGHDGSH